MIFWELVHLLFSYYIILNHSQGTEFGCVHSYFWIIIILQ